MGQFNWSVRRAYFRDVKGRIRFVKGCPATKLAYLKDLLPEIGERVQAIQVDLGREVGFAEAVELDPDIMSLGLAALELCGIKPNWVDLDIVAAFVCSYRDENDVAHPGRLREMYFVPTPSGGESNDGYGFEEHFISMFDSLVQINQGDTLKAYKTLDEIPMEQIEGLLAKTQEKAERQSIPPNRNGSNESLPMKIKSSTEIEAEWNAVREKARAEIASRGGVKRD